ncbi:AsmA family protein [Sphingomonas sanxanigenens]|uniref:AsmA domain-containing protein n=1 Tax=Sphingomonas sanxanigenens DSM 19645 = NX02 TaxID=1123269 RepID=W0AF66_9SPHN|nr:AsmA family protein [Sphingomonas sanxanigenens]AHE56519.1 hypothetical protein NX02_24560 [Sphingomonas sanxanigenens DSM 19645 = NX02]
MAEADPQLGVSDDALDAAARKAAAKRNRASAAIRRLPPGPVAAILSIIATIIGLVVLAWAVLYITKGRFLKHPFERMTSSLSARQVRVAGDFQLYFNPINIKFYAEGLTVSNPQWAKRRNFFAADRIDTNISTFTLIFGSRRVNWLDLTNGDVALEWDDAGRRNSWTFGDPDAKGAPLEIPLIRRATIAGTQAHYRDPKMQVEIDVKVDTVKATNTRFDNDIRFAGGGVLRGEPFDLSGSLMSPDETLAGGRNQFALAANAGPTRMTVSGTLPGATEIEGADLKLGVRGPNVSLLFDLIGIAVPDTRAYRFDSRLTKDGGAWKFTRINGLFGASDLAGSMTITMPEDRLKLDADLSTRTIDIIDIGPFIGYEPSAAAKGEAGIVETVGGTPRLLPDAPLRIEAIRGFDAHVVYKVRRVRAESFPVSDIALTLDLDRSLLTLSPLTFTMARGRVASDIVINARRNPAFTDYDIRLSPTPMGVLLAGFGVEQSGTTGTLSARVKLSGAGNSVHDSLASSNGRIAVILPRGTFWTRNIQLSELDIGTFVWKMFQDKLKKPVQINCGLIAFTVRDGIAAADPILIDTDKNVMLGRGGFSFKNESLDLAFRADSKKFSLFAGQSPVGINGYFARPGFSPLSPELMGRAGAGLGLAMIAAPPAAVLAFVDVGDAKSAACGPVLAGAAAAAQRTTKGERRDDVGRGTTAKGEDGKRTGGERKSQEKKFLGIF